MDKKTIVIMAAMQEECEILLNKINYKNINIIGKYKFYEGTIKEYQVVVCRCNVMTMNAAVATYIAIEKYKPECIIVQGTAGSHSENIHKNDIVIGEKCVNIVSAKTPHKVIGEGSNSLEWDIRSFFAEDDDKQEIYIANEELLDISKNVKYKDGKKYIGTIGSGDVWNNEIDRILFFNNKFKTLCEDMESIAVYKIANDFNIPVIGIRIISNNEIIKEEYDKRVAENLQEYIYELVLNIVQKN